jgi:hypothetical protein
MSFDFSSNINPPLKAHAAYKDGGGMGGGGMYFKQGKRKDEPEEDMFQPSEDNSETEIELSEIPEEEIPKDTIVNKFVNWFRINQD